MVSEIRRASVKVSGVDTLVGDRLAIIWLPRRAETSTIAKEHTQRRSKAGPKGTMVEVNRNVDSDFYEELFTMKGGVFDMIEKKCPWLRGKYYFLQQDGARPHTKEGLIQQLEMQVGTGEVDDFFCRFITQPRSHPILLASILMI